MWFKLGKNQTSLIENQFTQSDSALNADQQWSKNYDNPMHPYGAIAM